MFLVLPENTSEAVFVYDDPRTFEPDLEGTVIEGVTIERMDSTAECPLGFTPPQGSTLGQNPADAKRFKIFESEQVMQGGPYLEAPAKPRGPYRSWTEYIRERDRKAA